MCFEVKTVIFKEGLVEVLRLSKMPLFGSWIHSGHLVLNGSYSNKEACLAGSWCLELIIGCRTDGEKPFWLGEIEN